MVNPPLPKFEQTLPAVKRFSKKNVIFSKCKKVNEKHVKNKPLRRFSSIWRPLRQFSFLYGHKKTQFNKRLYAKASPSNTTERLAVCWLHRENCLPMVYNSGLRTSALYGNLFRYDIICGNLYENCFEKTTCFSIVAGWPKFGDTLNTPRWKLYLIKLKKIADLTEF